MPLLVVNVLDGLTVLGSRGSSGLRGNVGMATVACSFDLDDSICYLRQEGCLRRVDWCAHCIDCLSWADSYYSLLGW